MTSPQDKRDASDTPRTDVISGMYPPGVITRQQEVTQYNALLNHARQLERELNVLRGGLTVARAVLDHGTPSATRQRMPVAWYKTHGDGRQRVDLYPELEAWQQDQGWRVQPLYFDAPSHELARNDEGYPGIAHDLETMRTALRDATAIGIANLFAYCGAYENLSPHKKRQWDRLRELAKLTDSAVNASAPTTECAQSEPKPPEQSGYAGSNCGVDRRVTQAGGRVEAPATSSTPSSTEARDYEALLCEFENLILDANDPQLPRRAGLPVSKRLNEVRALLQAFARRATPSAIRDTGFACDGEGLTMRCPEQCEPCAKKAAAAVRLVRSFPGLRFQSDYDRWLFERDEWLGATERTVSE